MTSPTTQRAASSASVDMVDIIRTKRDGGRLNQYVINSLISAYVDGDVPDYQMSALLMAIVWRGLDAEETLQLTQAMVASGDTFDPGSFLQRRIVDKHSTGGVGDKVSLALAPIVAACGVPLGKMSGRGLGHTGGTLDKLESIPGFTVELSETRFLEQVRDIGVAIAGQTGDIVPADKQLYALRDVTGTVESIPLIAASIMSKKLAGGADAIVLDVKVGSGAFMKDLDQARTLADEMIAIGTGAGRAVEVLVTDMSRPLGRTVGNALEILEVVEVLDGGGPEDLQELVYTAASILLSMSDLDITEEEGLARAREAVTSGQARERWDMWIHAQGGDPYAHLELAPVEHTVLAHGGGTVTQLDALSIGLTAAKLGAGRARKDDAVDHGVGIRLHVTVGDTVATGEPLFTIYARTDEAAHQAASELLECTVVQAGASARKTRQSVIIERRN
jgi:pyrimidine-nucleoside phosphorylase